MDTRHLDILTRRIAAVESNHLRREGERVASVLLPIVNRGEVSVVGIWRTPQGIHGGQFAFPGGAVDDGDSDSESAARREAAEEIGLKSRLQVLGHLGQFSTLVSNYCVDVHVGFVDGSPRWKRNPDEVAAIVEIPISSLLEIHGQLPQVQRAVELDIDSGYEFDPSPFLIDGELPERGPGHLLETSQGPQPMPFVWGLTSRILYDFLQLVWQPSLEDLESSDRLHRD